MRKKKLAKNTISSLIFQVTTIVCGFILPRLILLYYGSETNGLVNSITQFLSIISFLELGVGAVVQSSLYKPLSTNDSVEVSKIVKSANKFFRTLAKIMLVYVGGLILFFPFVSNQSYNFAYTATLILASSNASFTSSNWVLQIIASIFLLLYLYFVYNVIFLPSKKLILCCYPCLVMLFMIKNLARKRNKPLQCVGLRWLLQKLERRMNQ